MLRYVLDRPWAPFWTPLDRLPFSVRVPIHFAHAEFNSSLLLLFFTFLLFFNCKAASRVVIDTEYVEVGPAMDEMSAFFAYGENDELAEGRSLLEADLEEGMLPSILCIPFF